VEQGKMTTDQKGLLSIGLTAALLGAAVLWARRYDQRGEFGRAQKPKRARYWRRQAERERKTLEKMKSRAGTAGRSLYQHAGLAGGDSRVYRVEFTEEWRPKLLQTVRIVAEGKLSRAEIRERMTDKGIPSQVQIVKIRSEAID
jgi:hypothetical protein